MPTACSRKSRRKNSGLPEKAFASSSFSLKASWLPFTFWPQLIPARTATSTLTARGSGLCPAVTAATRLLSIFGRSPVSNMRCESRRARSSPTTSSTSCGSESATRLFSAWSAMFWSKKESMIGLISCASFRIRSWHDGFMHSSWTHLAALADVFMFLTSRSRPSVHHVSCSVPQLHISTKAALAPDLSAATVAFGNTTPAGPADSFAQGVASSERSAYRCPPDTRVPQKRDAAEASRVTAPSRRRSSWACLLASSRIIFLFSADTLEVGEETLARGMQRLAMLSSGLPARAV
mmetsp:Transcript_14038/g.52607  ORF Transcript_14038/g.52607 Transcript_14038/m.52607 type:complete len:293 (+) Transcript_14038:3488-4366(+)